MILENEIAPIEVLSSGEICLLDCLHDARDELRQLMQRWDNKLTFENLSLVEKYGEGRCSVVLKLDVASGRCYYVQYSARTDTKCAVYKPRTTDYRVHISKFSNRHDWYQELVFVSNVESVESAKGIIPSLVRLYGVKDEIYDVGTCDLYFSTINSSFKFLPRIFDWEMRPLGRYSASHGHNIAGHDVQGGAQVMDGIADDERYFTRQRLGHFEFEDVASRIRLFIDAHSAEVGLDECAKYPVKLIDVLVGPFDL